MISHRLFFAVSVCALLLSTSFAAPPSLLKEAVDNWGEGKDDLAFTQKTRLLEDDGKMKEERVEHYDPSLPDNNRWKLVSVDGKEPTQQQIERIEVKRNKKPRKKAARPLEQYFELENAKKEEETDTLVRYHVSVRPETARLISVEKLAVELTVDKKTKTIDRVTAGLDEPMRIAMGIAKITEVDLDVRFDGDDEGKKSTDGRPKAEKSVESADTATGTAEVKMSKFGNRAEYSWSDFKRVTRYQGGATADASAKPASSDGKAHDVTNKSQDRR